MPKIILLNGPKSSGKDFAAKILLDALEDEDVVHLKMSQPLKNTISQYLGQDMKDLEASKEDIIPKVGASYRDLQIAMFTTMAKLLGDDWLGQTLVTRIKNHGSATIIVSDAGRNEDIVPLIKAFGASNILLMQLFRKGSNFQYDIRTYIDDPRVEQTLIHNDGTEQFRFNILSEALEFLAGGRGL